MPFLHNNILCPAELSLNTDELHRGIQPCYLSQYSKLSKILKTQKYNQSLLSLNKERILIIRELKKTNIRKYNYDPRIENILQIIKSAKENDRDILIIKSSIAVPEPYDQGGYFITETKTIFRAETSNNFFSFLMEGYRGDEGANVLAAGMIRVNSAAGRKIKFCLDFLQD